MLKHGRAKLVMVKKFSQINTKFHPAPELDALITKNPPFDRLSLSVRPQSCGQTRTDGQTDRQTWAL